MRGRTRTHNGVNAIIRGHQERDCLNKYSKLKEEIEYRITQLTKNHDSVFCRKCSGIKQDIFKKNADLDYCYRNNLLRHKLHEDSALSEFIKNCSGSSNCRKPTAVPKKPVALTNPKDVSCRKGSKGCNQSPAQPKTEEDKSQPRVNAETSKIIGSEGSASVKQGQEQDDGGKSRSAKIQAKPRTAPSHSPVGTHVEASQQLDNKHNTPSEEAVTQLQELSQGAPYTGSNLGDTSSDPSDQLNSQGDSEVNCTPQGTNLDTKCIQKNSSSIKNLDGNLSGEQTTIDGIAGRKDGSQVVTTSENPDDRSTSGQIDGDEKANAVGDPGGDDNNKSPVILPDPKECSNPGTTTCENGGSKRSGDRTNNSEASAEVASSRSHTDTHTENTSDSHTSSGSTGAGQNLLESSQENHGVTGTLGRSSSATAEVTEEIVKYENVLGILSQFFNKIPHKDYIMMGFIPMAFIPLLILLMKYTPLRAIFAKKKKKKRNDMNEKLQRVLFEPSNGSEEKRIPFSYSAFEYSS